MKLCLFQNKELKNAGWLIAGKIVQMLLSLVVSILTARYLGPSNYGLISYGNTYVAFFTSLCTLGINSIIIKDFFDHPEDEGLAVGTAIVLRIFSSIFSAITIFVISLCLDFGERDTIIIVVICSISLLFQAFDTFNYWFQSRYNSKITAIATLIAYVLTSLYKILLFILNKNIFWFAVANSFDYLVLGVLLYISYKTYAGPKLKFSFQKGKHLLSLSYHYILSGMMIAIYGQTDKLMLKHMLNEASVGYYTIATSICSMWTFVLQAIIDSLYPTILKSHNENEHLFIQKNRQLYCIVFYFSVFVSLIFLLLGDFVVNLLYGEEYLPSGAILKVITWYTAFAFLGVARNAWIVSEGKQKYLKYMYFGAALINILLNLVFIPVWGTIGAAFASLLTQIFTSLILPCFWKEMRPNAKIMIEGIFFKGVIPKNERTNGK